MALPDIDTVREVQWEASYKWNVWFSGAPPPFSSFFPATDVEENLYTVENDELDIGVTSISFPKTSKQFTIRLSFSDNEDRVLVNWVSDWVNKTIFNNSRVAPLSECVKLMSIEKYTRTDNLVKATYYRVYPVGSLFYHGTSTSQTPIYSIEFAVAEVLP